MDTVSTSLNAVMAIHSWKYLDVYENNLPNAEKY
jgi:hypothetical protein